MKTADKASISMARVKSINVGLKETENNTVYTRVIRKKSYELVQFLWSYKVQRRIFHPFRNRFKVRVDNKTIHAFRTDLTVPSSKLVPHAHELAQLIWYISFRRPPFSINGLFKFYFFISKIHDDTECGKKKLRIS